MMPFCLMDDPMARCLRLFAALLTLPLALASCKIDTINSFPTTNANVRFVNVMAGAAALDAAQGGTTVWPGVPLETGTGYRDFPPSDVNFAVSLPGSTTTLINTSYALFGEQPYTLTAYGSVAAPALLMMPDDTVAPGGGNFKLRIVNAATGIGFIDAYLTKPDDAIDNLSPSFFGVNTGIATISNRYAVGQYRLRLAFSGTKTVIYDSGSLSYADGRNTAAIVYTKGSAQLVNVVLADFNGTAAVAPANSTQARIKSIHAAPQTGAVNMLVDGAAIVSGEIYPSPSLYANVSSGTRAITYEAVATPGATIAAVTGSLGAATDTSILLTGFAGALQAIALSDFNLPSVTNRPRVRFVNASPDAPPLDVLNGAAKQVSALASPTASGYVEFDSGTYTFTINNAATGATLLSVPDVVLFNTETATVYIVGGVTQLAAMVVIDR